MHDSNNWQFAVTIGAIVIGVFLNNRKSDDVRRELQAQLLALRSETQGQLLSFRSEVHGDINLLTGKFIELIDRLAKVEAKLEAK